MIDRHISPHLQQALKESPVVLLHGARQTGKSTLAQHIAMQRSAQYLTLDDPAVLTAAHTAPDDFVAAIESPVIIDEVQRAPELFRAIKLSVDKQRTAGRFLLTGSANMLLIPRLSESLAGRMRILTLHPFSQGEIENRQDSFVANVFARQWKPSTARYNSSRASLARRVALGGYPEVQTLTAEASRTQWFNSYITTILQRDVRELANIERLTLMPRLLALIAARASALLNFAELSRSAAIPQSTLKRYLTLLETTYLIALLPAWSTNLGKRLIKTPKLFVADTGLGVHLSGINEKRLLDSSETFGKLLETFVLMEILKQTTWNLPDVHVYYFRTADGQEVDFVLEQRDGTVVGVEVKSSSSIDSHAVKGMKALAELAGKRFRRGIILYTGSVSLPLGKNIIAAPIASIWR
jgi:hypothetical protein